MEAKTTDWRPGPSVCRCCLTEGCYKDISTEYFWMGKREVYAEMLADTLNLTIAYSQSGGPNSNSRLICEPCISRLRDAAEFKRQVVECEKTFLQHLDPNSSIIPEDVTSDAVYAEREVKVEQVKIERAESEGEFEDQSHFVDEDDDDDLDDQPLTKLASKAPKKETVDLLDLIDNAKVTEKRKSTVKVKSTPVKKAKLKKETKASASKIKPEKKKKDDTEDVVRSNAETIITYSTAYPFRVNDKIILCVYCYEAFEDPDAFRGHMRADHVTFNLDIAFHNIPKLEFIKADVADLNCRICDEKFPDLDKVAEHLRVVHDKTIYVNDKLGIMPYSLKKDVFVCYMCKKVLPSLFHLNRHTITHFRTFVCHVCAKSYLATTGLLRHLRTKHQKYEVPCKSCGKVFPDMESKDQHRRVEKKCQPYPCPKCPERFLASQTRQQHLETAHGVERKDYRCGSCDVVFSGEKAYYTHFRLEHSEDCATCKHCGMKFLNSLLLKRHLAKH